MYVTSPAARPSQLLARTTTHAAELGAMVSLAAPSPRYTLADLTVHPSPAATEFTIALTHSRTEKATLQVVNLLGTTVAQQAANLRPGTNRLPLPVGQLRAGQYLLLVKTAGELTTRHFTKS
ncbi:MAG TPA: T9SS type A sorting domain-containing protein [Hymenobacter sp.]|uniref:T9SS type A sorting domain-containing protein n=1 Tax=Hymenobacter sp. TaxID=1898978 RepID=UPI002D80B43C|nr:T9SS type A sorting domain-containing protein [Hymenobacter sp.]HET9502237.1 T9SS type A sorting domain-containing protein [Hymenobacter sp.]